jgi:hypothetical protein
MAASTTSTPPQDDGRRHPPPFFQHADADHAIHDHPAEHGSAENRRRAKVPRPDLRRIIDPRRDPEAERDRENPQRDPRRLFRLPPQEADAEP